MRRSKKLLWIAAAIGIAIIVIVGAIAGGAGGGNGETDEGDAEAEADRIAGFHCLSAWDGDHEGFEDLVRPNLTDPKSMDTLETRITPIDEDGRHIIYMDFTADNAFGGTVKYTAAGYVDNETCEAELVDIQ